MKSQTKFRKWRHRLRSKLPTADSIRGNRWIGWIGPALHHPRLWHLNRKGVALGVAIGIFFGFLIPLAQIPIAALAAVWLRGNIIAAVSATLITNPLTFAPIYVLANKIGSFVLDDRVSTDDNLLAGVAYQASDLVVGWIDKFLAVGQHIAVGLSLLAVFGSIASYFLVLWIWKLVVSYEWKTRRHSRKQ